MSFVSSLESASENCIRAECKAGNCLIRLSGFPGERVILDVDCMIKPSAPGRRCDRIVVVCENNETFLLPVEFKSSNTDLAKIKNQLEGGIKFFKDYTSQYYFPDQQFKYFPMFASKKLRPTERDRLRKIKVQCNGASRRIKHVLCNRALKWRDVKKS